MAETTTAPSNGLQDGDAAVDVSNDPDAIVVEEDGCFTKACAKCIYPWFAVAFLTTLVVFIVGFAIKAKETFWLIFLIGMVCSAVGTWAVWKFGVIEDQINKFKEENNKYRQQIDELTQTREALTTEVDGIQAHVGNLEKDASELDEQLGEFDELRKQLEDIAGENQKLNDMLNDTNKIFTDMRTTVLENERAHLLNFFYECALRDENETMDKREYRRFLGRLSAKQRQKFEALGSFEDLAGADLEIDIDEFQDMIRAVLSDVDEILKEQLSA